MSNSTKLAGADNGNGGKPMEDSVSLMLKDLTHLEDTDESDGDEELNENEEIDEEAINKELVTWAGRLELESIDLREKAKALTSQMTQNSESIKNTAQDLKSEFKSWKETSNKSLDGAIQTFSKASASFSNASKVLSSLKGKDKSTTSDIQKILETLKSAKATIESLQVSHTNSSKKQVNDITNSVLSKKIQTVINGIQNLTNHVVNVEEARKQNDKNQKTINDTLEKCLRRIEDIQNLQVDFNRELKSLSRSQASLSLEFYKFKTINRRNDENQITTFTPESSFNDSRSDSALNHQLPSSLPTSNANTSQQHDQSQIPPQDDNSTQTTKTFQKPLSFPLPKRRGRPPKVQQRTSTFKPRTRSSQVIIDNYLYSDNLPAIRTRKKKDMDEGNRNHHQEPNHVERQSSINDQLPKYEEVISLLSDDAFGQFPVLSDL